MIATPSSSIHTSEPSRAEMVRVVLDFVATQQARCEGWNAQLNLLPINGPRTLLVALGRAEPARRASILDNHETLSGLYKFVQNEIALSAEISEHDPDLLVIAGIEFMGQPALESW